LQNRSLDCFVASLLAMTARCVYLWTPDRIPLRVMRPGMWRGGERDAYELNS